MGDFLRSLVRGSQKRIILCHWGCVVTIIIIIIIKSCNKIILLKALIKNFILLNIKSSARWKLRSPLKTNYKYLNYM